MNTPHPAQQAPTKKGVRRATRATSTPTAQESTRVVLDTCVVMVDPNAHLAYQGCEVVVPLTVIDELDNNKTRSDAAGRNARHFLQSVEALRREAGGRLSDTFPLPGGSTLRIEPNGLHLGRLAEMHLSTDVPDHRIIAAALGLADSTDRPVVLVSNDVGMRVKATAAGLDTAEHTPGRIGVHAPNRTGYHEVVLSPETITAVSRNRRTGVPVDGLPPEDQAALADVLENEFIWVTGTAVTARLKAGSLHTLDRTFNPYGAKSLNKEQAFALDLLSDENVDLIALRGHAGTGKTLLAIAAGLEAVIEKRSHAQLVILRPMVSVGRQELGFLPGDVAEKTQPWFDAVIDVLMALSEPDSRGKKITYADAKTLLDGFIADGKVVLAPVTFLRGRTFHSTFLIMDEAQNVDPGTIKTVISRLGNGSKLVLTGDDGQIDVPFASALTCGLNVAVDAFAGEDLFGQIHFAKGERSRLADLAAERM